MYFSTFVEDVFYCVLLYGNKVLLLLYYTHEFCCCEYTTDFTLRKFLGRKHDVMVFRRSCLAIRVSTLMPSLRGSVGMSYSLSQTCVLSSVASKMQPRVRSLCTAVTRETTLVEELHRLEHESPWWKSAFLRAAGTFSAEQRQAAAGGDMYFLCGQQAKLGEFCDPLLGGLQDRYYVRFQLVALHCWMCHVRLRQEPKERYQVLFKEMMEKVWGQAELDLYQKFQMGFLQISKHLKEMQFAWHGTARALDAALDAKLPDEQSRAELQLALRRNLYADERGDPLSDSERGAVSRY